MFFCTCTFFTFVLEIVNDTVFFRFLVSRGEACGKKIQTEQKRIDGRFFIIHLKSVCHPKYFCIFVANKL